MVVSREWNEYPRTWDRGLDFLVTLPHSAALYKQKPIELYYGVFYVSKYGKLGYEKGKVNPTEYGSFHVDAMDSNKFYYEMKGDPFDPKGSRRVPQHELLKDFQDHSGLELNLLIKDRAIAEQLPKSLENETTFQGIDEVYSIQSGFPNHYHQFRRYLPSDWYIHDPYRITKGILMDNGLIKRGNDPMIKSCRSVLKDVIINTDTKFWDQFGSDGTSKIIEARAQSHKSMDQGIPVNFALNGLEGQIYDLKVRGGKVIV